MIHRCTTKLEKKKHYGQKCMQDIEKALLKNLSDIEKFIKHHDFPKEGTLSLTRLKVVRDSVEQSSDKQPFVVANVLNMYVKNVNKQ